MSDPGQLRQQVLDGWEQAAPRWGRNAERLREVTMPIALALIERLHLQPGQTVLELAAGPGDTGFMAAELVQPGGTLICSDGAEAMLDVARRRAEALGVPGVEFKLLQLEWIDLPAASVDALLCRWGLMFAVDPGAAVREMRRVLRPGARVALAVWDEAQHNPWAALPMRALRELGHLPPPDPDVPGMFVLGEPGRMQELLEEAGFVDCEVEGVELPRHFPDVDGYLAETAELSGMFGEKWAELADEERGAVRELVGSLTEPYAAPDGALTVPGRSLVAAASA
jgi:SAM-dependent methyltransferase